MMILLGNKQKNSLILLGFLSFSRMEIPVYNLGKCILWDKKLHCILNFGIFVESLSIQSDLDNFPSIDF